MTTRAPSSTASCGGRGGDNSPTAAGDPPSTAGDCDDGGGDPSGRQGGGATVGGGGGPTFLAGGSAYTGSTAQRIGGGGGGGAIGAEAGGYDDGANSRGYGGGGGSGTVDAGVSTVSGAAGSVTVVAPVVNDQTRDGTWADNSTTVTITTGNLLNAPVIRAGCTVQSAQIGPSNNNTVVSVTATTMTMQFMTTQARTTQNLRFDCDGSTTPTPGGSSDPYYSPSYLGTTVQNPGRGGTTGASGGSTSRDGR